MRCPTALAPASSLALAAPVAAPAPAARGPARRPPHERPPLGAAPRGLPGRRGARRGPGPGLDRLRRGLAAARATCAATTRSARAAVRPCGICRLEGGRGGVYVRGAARRCARAPSDPPLRRGHAPRASTAGSVASARTRTTAASTRATCPCCGSGVRARRPHEPGRRSSPAPAACRRRATKPWPRSRPTRTRRPTPCSSAWSPRGRPAKAPRAGGVLDGRSPRAAAATRRCDGSCARTRTRISASTRSSRSRRATCPRPWTPSSRSPAPTATATCAARPSSGSPRRRGSRPRPPSPAPSKKTPRLEVKKKAVFALSEIRRRGRAPAHRGGPGQPQPRGAGAGLLLARPVGGPAGPRLPGRGAGAPLGAPASPRPERYSRARTSAPPCPRGGQTLNVNPISSQYMRAMTLPALSLAAFGRHALETRGSPPRPIAWLNRVALRLGVQQLDRRRLHRCRCRSSRRSRTTGASWTRCPRSDSARVTTRSPTSTLPGMENAVPLGLRREQAPRDLQGSPPA